MDALEFVKRCLDGEAVVVKEVGGWKAVWKEKVITEGFSDESCGEGRWGGALL